MKMGRRTFILGAGLAAAAPALAGLFALARTYASPPPAPLQDNLVFRIDGWSASDPVSIGGVSATGEEVWLSVSRSWRTAWR
jgi:hypothetical protein